MVVDVQVRKRRSPRGSWSPRLDWTGGQGESTREGVCQFSPLPVSTRFSARKLGKYLGLHPPGIQVPAWQTR